MVAVVAASCAPASSVNSEFQPLRLARPKGSVGVRYESTSEKTEGALGNVKTAGTTLEEFLELKTRGSVVHPNLLEFTASGLFGLSQEHFTEDDRTDSANGDILEYDLAADILQQKLFPTHVYASRSDRLVPRRFESSLRVKRIRDGVRMRMADDRTPMSLEINREQVTEGIQSSVGEGAETQSWNLAYNAATSLGRAGRLLLGYLHNETQTDAVSESLIQDELKLNHNIFFFGNERHRLATRFRYNEQQGTTPITDVDLRTQLKLKHTDTFSTDYRIGYRDRQREELGQKLLDTQAGFTHQLYRSLKTTGRVYESEDRSSGGLTTTRSGGGLSVNYRKLTGLGTLFLGASGNSDVSSDKGVTNVLFVIDESHNLSSLLPTFLVEQNIVAGSIFVTDSAGKPLVEGLDYIVTQVGTMTSLRITPLGSDLNEGDEVLVDYQYTRPGDNRQRTNTVSWYARHTFSFGLTPYVRFTDRNVTITPRSPGLLENDEQTTTLGAEQRLGPFTFSVERRTSDMATSPYRSMRYSGGYHAGRTDGTRFGISADYANFDFLAPNERTTRAFSASAKVERPLTKQLKITCGAGYRSEDDSVTGHTSSSVGRAGLTWAFRAFRLSTNAEHSWGSFPDGNTQYTAFNVTIERKF